MSKVTAQERQALDMGVQLGWYFVDGQDPTGEQFREDLATIRAAQAAVDRLQIEDTRDKMKWIDALLWTVSVAVMLTFFWFLLDFDLLIG